MSQADAAAACNDGFASLKDLLSPDQFNSKVQNCISDMVNTGDNQWLQADVVVAEALAVHNAEASLTTTTMTTTTTLSHDACLNMFGPCTCENNAFENSDQDAYEACCPEIYCSTTRLFTTITTTTITTTTITTKTKARFVDPDGDDDWYKSQEY